jgi:hypothetical protein
VKIMSFVLALNPTPELGLYAIGAGVILLLLTVVIFVIRSSSVKEERPPLGSSLGRKTGFKPPSTTGRRSGFKPPSRSGSNSGRRPTLAPPDDEEEYLRENSMLPYSPDSVEGKSDPFHQGGFRERRSAPRRAGNPVDVLLSDSKSEAEPVAGIVLDRSATGLGLELWAEGDIRPGTIITVRPRKASSDSSWVRVIVRRCEKRKDSWLLGCEFIRPPGVHAMMEFG